jgi:biopolymer transport protein ExbD
VKLHSPIPHKRTRLEIIPLIDVMFFLLASFMMVSLTMTKQQTIKVNLPVAAASQPDFKPDMINLGVNAAGDLFFDKSPISLPALEQKLKQRFTQDPQTPVYISGDAATPYAAMIKALDAARRAGFVKVAFNVKAAAASSSPSRAATPPGASGPSATTVPAAPSTAPAVPPRPQPPSQQ